MLSNPPFASPVADPGAGEGDALPAGVPEILRAHAQCKCRFHQMWGVSICVASSDARRLSVDPELSSLPSLVGCHSHLIFMGLF